jgi:hypothetical protein
MVKMSLDSVAIVATSSSRWLLVRQCLEIATRRVMLLLLGMVVCMGCGEATTSPGATVRGVVRLDGQPIQDGYISFIPTNRDGTTAGAKISGGAYTAYTSPVAMRVEIVSTKTSGAKTHKEYDPSQPITLVIENLIPPRYNTESQLALVVTPGKNTADFDLESSPKLPAAQ